MVMSIKLDCHFLLPDGASYAAVQCGIISALMNFFPFSPSFTPTYAASTPFACLVYFISASSHNQFSRRRERELGADLPEFRQPKASPSQ